jgi:predicted GNAT superfamily acetyltransferase
MLDNVLRPIVLPEIEDGFPLAMALLSLNNTHAEGLSWLDPERLRALIGIAFAATRIGSVDAWLLAFDQDATYDSPNSLSQGHARPGARQPTTPITGRILWRVLPLS